MILTLLAVLCVVGTKLLTSIRLRGLRSQLLEIQPVVDDLRAKAGKAEEEAASLQHQITVQETLLAGLQDAVRALEANALQSGPDLETAERMVMLRTLADTEPPEPT